MAIETLFAELERVTAQLTEMEEEHGGEEGAFASFSDKVNKANVGAAAQGARRSLLVRRGGRCRRGEDTEPLDGNLNIKGVRTQERG